MEIAIVTAPNDMLKEIGVDRQPQREADGGAPELRKSYLEEFNPLNPRLYDKKTLILGEIG